MNRTTLPTHSHLIGLSIALLAAGGCGNKEASASKAAPTVQETSQAHPAPAAAAEKLRDGEYAKFNALVGEWHGKGSLKMGGNDIPVTSVLQCSVARGGVAVTCVHEADIEGMGTMVENALFGLDPATQKLHWYNINTMGETHDHIGSWTDKGIDWRFDGTQEGKPMVETITMRLDGSSMSFRSETTVGGQQASLFEGTLTK